jgi:hypothetical protein
LDAGGILNLAEFPLIITSGQEAGLFVLFATRDSTQIMPTSSIIGRNIMAKGYDWRGSQSEQKADKENRGEPSRIVISFPENGFLVRCEYDPKDPKKPSPDSPEYVFPDAAGALKHVKEKLEYRAKYEKQEK